jgi:ubiquinol-cytochrome c reductase cytochrome c1 subunit
MPNVLGPLQGDQALEVEKHGDGHESHVLKQIAPGSMSTAEYNATVGDLVNYLDFMSEPAKLVRYKLGYIVLSFLFVLLILTYLLKKEFWKDIH